MKKFLLMVVMFVIYLPAFSDELPAIAPIIISDTVKVTWQYSTDPVNFYTVYLLHDNIKTTMSPQTSNFFSHSLKNYANFDEPKRVRIYVTASNETGESAPSDTVSYIYANHRVLFGDYDNSGKIDGIDLTMFWNSFWCKKGINAGYKSIFDADQNGMIDGLDHMYILINFYHKLP